MKKFILLIVFICVCIFCWFFIEPELITVHKYKIHNPDLFPEIPSHVDLTLCGHTHGGQVVLPILGIMGTKFVPLKHGNKYVRGFIEEDNKKMIVTNGLGTSIFPVRFNAFPEIVVIDFY